MCSPSPPPAPDYAAAAAQQAQANKEAAIASSRLNNPNVVNPYGTQTWTEGAGERVFDQAGYDRAMADYQARLSQGQTGTTQTNDFTDGTNVQTTMGGFRATGGSGYTGAAPNRDDFYSTNGEVGRPTLTQTLSPEQQALYEQSVRTKQLLGGLGQQGATALQGVVGKNLDFSGAPAAPGNAAATRDSVINAMMSRVDEDTARARDQANSDLIAAGIRPGTKAYQDRMFAIDRGYNDARQQAILAAGQEGQRDFNMDTQARKDAIAEILAQRQTPLNEINALMSGSQVNNPFAVPGAAQNSNIAPAPIFGAATAQGQADMNAYNAQAAQAGGMMSGLFGLGAAGIGAYPWGK